MFCLHFGENQLRGIADHEILLVNPKQPAVLIRIVRIQEQRQILLDVFLVEVDSIFDERIVYRDNVEQTQLIHTVVVAHDVNVVHPGSYFTVAKTNLERNIRLILPGLRLNPRILDRLLQPVFNNLMEQTVMIVQTDAFSRKAERCDRIQEACRQSSKTAVPQRRFRLHLFNLREIFAVLLQKIIHPVIDLEIDQIVGQKLADQEFRGNVVNFLFPRVTPADLQQLLAVSQNDIVQFLVRALRNGLAIHVAGDLRDLFLHVQGQNIFLHVCCFSHSTRILLILCVRSSGNGTGTSEKSRQA